MAGTRLYLLDTTTISHPAALNSGTRSLTLPVGVDHSFSAETARDMKLTKGSGIPVAARSTSTGAVATLTSARHATFVSDLLGGTDIAAQNWTFAMAFLENNASANQQMACCLYVITTGGTVRGFIYDSSSPLAAEFTVTMRTRVATVSGAQVTGVLSTDQLVFELWCVGTQGTGVNRTVTSNWSGTIDPAGDVPNASAASYVEAATQNVFEKTVPVSVASAPATGATLAPRPAPTLAAASAPAVAPTAYVRFPPVLRISLLPPRASAPATGPDLLIHAIDNPVIAVEHAAAPASAPSPELTGQNVPIHYVRIAPDLVVASAPASNPYFLLFPDITTYTTVEVSAASAPATATLSQILGPPPTHYVEIAPDVSAASAPSEVGFQNVVTGTGDSAIVSIDNPAACVATAPSTSSVFDFAVSLDAARAYPTAPVPDVPSARAAAAGLIFLFGDAMATYTHVDPSVAAAPASAAVPGWSIEVGFLPVIHAGLLVANASAVAPEPEEILIELDLAAAEAPATATVIAVGDEHVESVSPAPAAASAFPFFQVLGPEVSAAAATAFATMGEGIDTAQATATAPAPTLTFNGAILVTAATAAATGPTVAPGPAQSPVFASAPATGAAPAFTLRLFPPTVPAPATATIIRASGPVFDCDVPVTAALAPARGGTPFIGAMIVTAQAHAYANLPIGIFDSITLPATPRPTLTLLRPNPDEVLLLTPNR